jgi:hypothetical protein
MSRLLLNSDVRHRRFCMTSSLRLWLLLGVLALQFGSPRSLVAGEEATRTFPAQNCRFTLPGPDWTWIDKQVPNVVFMARNSKGFVINLSTKSTPQPVQLDKQFVAGFEKTFYQPGQVEKRGGRFITFRGLPSYQAEGVLADGRTAASRVFAAHGLVYHLTLLGGKQPIEHDPAFEALMLGFDFTVPPEQAAKRAGPAEVQAASEAPGQTPPATDPDAGKTLNISAWAGRIAGLCIIGIIVVGLFRWVVRRRKTGQT